MASENEASCVCDPNFAVICSFLEKFAQPCGITHPNFSELQRMLENKDEVPAELIDLHVKLLRKARKSVTTEKWERAVIKFCHTHAGQQGRDDGWEVERFGYLKSRLDIKIRILKMLLEFQFDFNAKFKAEINRLASEELRLQPLGRDRLGHNYWLQMDEFCNLTVFQEDLDDEKWEVVARDRETFVQLIERLSDGKVETALNSEDSNSLETEGTFLDTGQKATEPPDGKAEETPVDNTEDSKSSTKVEDGAKEESKEEASKEENKEEASKEESKQEVSTAGSDDTQEGKEEVPVEDEKAVKTDKEPPGKKRKTEEVSDAIEEPVLEVKGEGSGNDCETGNPFVVGEAIEEEVMYFAGEGSGRDCCTGNPKAEAEEAKCVLAEERVINHTNSNDDHAEVDGALKKAVDNCVHLSQKAGEENESKKADVLNDKSAEAAVIDSSVSATNSLSNKGEDPLNLDMLQCGFFFGPGSLQSNKLIPTANEDKSKKQDLNVLDLGSEEPVKSNFLQSMGEMVDKLEKPKDDAVFRAPPPPPLTKEIRNKVERIPVKSSEGLSKELEAVSPDQESNEPSDRLDTGGELDESTAKEESESKRDESMQQLEKGEPRSKVDDQAVQDEKDIDKEKSRNVSDSSKASSASSEKDPKESYVLPVQPESPTEAQHCKDSISVRIEDGRIPESVQLVKSSSQPNAGAVEDASEKAEDTKEISLSREDRAHSEELSKPSDGVRIDTKSSQKNGGNVDSTLRSVTEEVGERKQDTSESTEKISSSEKEASNQQSESLKSAGKESSSSANESRDQNKGASSDKSKSTSESSTKRDSQSLSPPVGTSVVEGKASNAEGVSVAKIEESSLAIAEKSGEGSSNTEEKQLSLSDEVVNDGESRIHDRPTEASLEKSNKEEVVVPPSANSIAANAEEHSSSSSVADVVKPSENLYDSIAVPAERASEESCNEVDAKNDKVCKSNLMKHGIPEDATEVPEKKAKTISEDLVSSESNSVEETGKQGPEEEKQGSDVTIDQKIVKEEKAVNDLETEKPGDKKEDEDLPLAVRGRGTRGESGRRKVKKEEAKSKADAETEKDTVVEAEGAKRKRAESNGSQRIAKGDEVKEKVKQKKTGKKEVKKDVAMGTRVTRHTRSAKKEAEEEPQAKTSPGFTLATFSMEYEEPPPTPSNRGRKRRKDEPTPDGESSQDVTKDEDEEVEDVGGKKPKLRGRRPADKSLRQQVEEQHRGEASSSEDGDAEPAGPQRTEAGAEVRGTPRPGRGRPRGRGRKALRGRRPGQMYSSRAESKNDEEGEPTTTKEEADSPKPKDEEGSLKPRKKKSRILANLGVDEDTQLTESKEDDGGRVRASRRIAQIKIKEQAEKREMEEAMKIGEMSLKELQKKIRKSEKDARKAAKLDKKKNKKLKVKQEEEKEEYDPAEEDSLKIKKKRKKKKQHPVKAFNQSSNPWFSSSGSSSSEEEEEEEEQIDQSDDDAPLVFKSDHEFSPESDVEDEDYQPTRRARTARKGDKDTGEDDDGDDHACKKCSKSDHPEWLLLCDKCDAGWHCSCLRPALLTIPEGDWFCPPCEHTQLIERLQKKLQVFDQHVKRLENEELRKKRMTFVDISLENVLPEAECTQIRKKQKHRSQKDDKKSDPDAELEGGSETPSSSSSGSSSSESESSSSDSSSDEEEPIYQLRQRRQANVNYRFNDYDDLIKSAIQDEMDATVPLEPAAPVSRGKDLSSIVAAETNPQIGDAPAPPPERKVQSIGKRMEGEDEEEEKAPAEKPEKKKHTGKHFSEDDEEEEEEEKPKKDSDDEEEEGYVPPVVKKANAKGKKKKHRSLTALSSSGEDDADDDEDFKGSSSSGEDEDEDEYDHSESDDSEIGYRKRGKRNSGPVRRSGRARTTRFDREFINDESDDSDAPRKKKTRRVYESSDSDESDWRGRKKKSKPPPSFPKKSKKKSKKSRNRILDSDNEAPRRKKKGKIKYGLDDDGPSARRTRGRKINYQETFDSESEEDTSKKPSTKKDSEDEFVPNVSDAEDKADGGMESENESTAGSGADGSGADGSNNEDTPPKKAARIKKFSRVIRDDSEDEDVDKDELKESPSSPSKKKKSDNEVPAEPVTPKPEEVKRPPRIKITPVLVNPQKAQMKHLQGIGNSALATGDKMTANPALRAVKKKEQDAPLLAGQLKSPLKRDTPVATAPDKDKKGDSDEADDEDVDLDEDLDELPDDLDDMPDEDQMNEMLEGDISQGLEGEKRRKPTDVSPKPEMKIPLPDPGPQPSAVQAPLLAMQSMAQSGQPTQPPMQTRPLGVPPMGTPGMPGMPPNMPPGMGGPPHGMPVMPPMRGYPPGIPPNMQISGVRMPPPHMQAMQHADPQQAMGGDPAKPKRKGRGRGKKQLAAEAAAAAAAAAAGAGGAAPSRPAGSASPSSQDGSQSPVSMSQSNEMNRLVPGPPSWTGQSPPSGPLAASPIRGGPPPRQMPPGFMRPPTPQGGPVPPPSGAPSSEEALRMRRSLPQLYHSTHHLDPSPSGGGPINLPPKPSSSPHQSQPTNHHGMKGGPPSAHSPLGGLHGPPHGPPLGPPHGPPQGPPHGPPQGPPHGPPQGPPQGPSPGVPQGPPHGPPVGSAPPSYSRVGGPPPGGMGRFPGDGTPRHPYPHTAPRPPGQYPTYHGTSYNYGNYLPPEEYHSGGNYPPQQQHSEPFHPVEGGPESGVAAVSGARGGAGAPGGPGGPPPPQANSGAPGSGGDEETSEFGGLVSYFSSQQEDDIDA